MTDSQASPPPGGNWFSEWHGRTPIVCRTIIYTVLPLTTLALLVPSVNSALVNTPSSLGGGQIWRLVTALIDQGQLFSLLFVVIMLALNGPNVERAAGSLRFLLQIVIFGILINIAYALFSFLLFSFAAEFAFTWFGMPVSSGLWPVFMAIMTINALSDPTGSSPFCCMSFPNRLFPWALLAIFSLIAFSIQLDLTLGVLLGHAYVYVKPIHYWITPSQARLARWEAGVATRIRFATASGYVPLPASGVLAVGDAAAENSNPFSGFSSFGRRPPASGEDAGDGSNNSNSSQGASGGATAPPASIFAGTPQRIGGGGTGGGSSAAASNDTSGATAAQTAASISLMRENMAKAALARQLAISGGSTPSSSAPIPAVVKPGKTATESDTADTEGYDEESAAESSTLLPQQQQQQQQPKVAKPPSSEDKIAKIVASGFNRKEAISALALRGGDVDAAVNHLLDQ